MNDISHKTGPKDVFLQLLVMVLLYMTTVNLGVLLFQLINITFPDPLGLHGYIFSDYGVLRWAVATLIVTFPVYLWLSWALEKEMIRFPEKRELRTRKWLLYFTIFAAAVVIIVDLIALVYNYLEGELTVRFFLKILSIFFISGATFGYYLWKVKTEKPITEAPRMKFFALGVILLVVAAMVTGFFTAGLPQSTRLVKLDEQRINNLQTIQWQIIEFRRNKKRLPYSLNELNDPLIGSMVPKDPVTGEEYEYRTEKDIKGFEFELCATFQTDSRESKEKNRHIINMPPDGSLEDVFEHGKGRTCFHRVIDPERHGINVPLPVKAFD